MDNHASNCKYQYVTSGTDKGVKYHLYRCSQSQWVCNGPCSHMEIAPKKRVAPLPYREALQD